MATASISPRGWKPWPNEGGGICITGPVYDQVKNRFSQQTFQFIGKQTVKNIIDPVRVYRVALPSTHDSAVPVEDSAAFDEKDGPQGGEPVTIGIMPFENFSDSLDDDYFSIGFVEDLTTDLAHFSNLQVIASYTTRKMGEETKDLMTVARELGIDYLLRGNIRRLSDQLRISTQLTATGGGRILWAERYDAPLATLFEIQDDIVARVVSAISTQIDRALLAAARKKPITSMAAYDLWLRGMARLRQGTPVADQEARRMFKQALAVDPHYSRAYAGLSLSHFNDWSCQLLEQWETTERKAYDYALKAYQLNETDHVVQMILGRILLYRRQFDSAAHHLDQALLLNANDADNLVQIASCMGWLARPEDGERLFLKGLRLNPYHDNWYYTYGAFLYFIQQRYDLFVETALKGPLTEVWIDQPAYLAAAHAHLGNAELATDYLRLFLKTFTREIFGGQPPQPSEMVDWIRTANPFKLKAGIEEAEVMNDLGRKEILTEELDRLTAHLAKALGLGGRTRNINPVADRARSAVTWRIRSAIRKIKTVHPSLANHFSHAIRTGTFCSYVPEKEQRWDL